MTRGEHPREAVTQVGFLSVSVNQHVIHWSSVKDSFSGFWAWISPEVPGDYRLGSLCSSSPDLPLAPEPQILQGCAGWHSRFKLQPTLGAAADGSRESDSEK